MEEIRATAFKYAIKNAYLHQGKADIGAVIGKVLALHKVGAQKIIPIVKEVVGNVNEKSLIEIERLYKSFEEQGFELHQVEKEPSLPELDWANSKPVVTRYAPNPNGPFHLGNARVLWLSNEFARKYKGKFILRFEDTDPKTKKSMDNPRQVFEEDLKFLGITPDEVYFASDRLDIYYEYMRKLLNMNKAYVCFCDSENWRKLTANKQACPCRNKKKQTQISNFDKMLNNEIKEGEAVLRIKTDLNDKDPSVRDWWIAKVVDNPKHPNPAVLNKHVWPSYMFQAGIDDHLMGITLIVRGQEHSQNQTKQQFMYDYFGWEYPHSYHVGRIKLGKMVLSTSKISKGISEGLYSGWNDVRLGTIKALKRRGITKETIAKVILKLGVNTNDSTIDEKYLADVNKEFIVNQVREKPFFEGNLISVEILHTPNQEIENYGKKFIPESRILRNIKISAKEFEKIVENDVFRLKTAFNVRVISKSDFEVTCEYVSSTKSKDYHIVSWILNPQEVEILMDDASIKRGVSSAGFLVGEMIHFESVGFCKVEKIENDKVFVVFGHK